MFLADYDERAMKEWLLKGVTTGDYEPYEIRPEPSIPSQIEGLYCVQPIEVQLRFKRAIVSAVAEWTSATPLAALRTLAYLAAYVRAVDVVPQFAHLVRSRLIGRERATEGDEHEETIETIGVLLAVISGFAPYPQASAAAEAFYYDDRLPSRFAPISLNALCRTDPERYPEYLPRMIRLIERERRAFHVPLILDRLVETITPPLFAKHIAELDIDVKSTLISMLNAAPRIRARVEADEKTYSLITSYDGEETLYNCPVPEPEKTPTVRDLGPIYDELFGSYGGADELDVLLKTGGFAPSPSILFRTDAR